MPIVSNPFPSGGIVNYPGPGYYPAMAADLINASWAMACEKVYAYDVKIDEITNEDTGWLGAHATPTISSDTVADPSVTEPTVDIPSSANASDVMSLFDTKYLELVGMLSTKFTDFRTAYFPDEQTAYTAAEDWLQEALSSDTGLPDAVVTALLQDDEARILKDSARATDAVLQTFAARRFPLPPGAAASATLQIQQTAQDKIAESGRKIIAASIEQFRFLIPQMLSLRQLAMGTAVEYIKALASGPEMASRLVGIGYDAQSKLISAASQFYNSRTAVQELVAKTRQFNVQTALEASSKNQAAELTLIEDKLKALLTECQALAQMATALFNNLHTGATVSASGSDSTTDSLDQPNA